VFSRIRAWAGYEIWPAGTLAEVQYRATCDALGVEFFLEKPVDLQDLLRLVERLTGANDVL
jgi:hypothetical protein